MCAPISRATEASLSQTDGQPRWQSPDGPPRLIRGSSIRAQGRTHFERQSGDPSRFRSGASVPTSNQFDPQLGILPTFCMTRRRPAVESGGKRGIDQSGKPSVRLWSETTRNGTRYRRDCMVGRYAGGCFPNDLQGRQEERRVGLVFQTIYALLGDASFCHGRQQEPQMSATLRGLGGLGRRDYGL